MSYILIKNIHFLLKLSENINTESLKIIIENIHHAQIIKNILIAIDYKPNVSPNNSVQPEFPNIKQVQDNLKLVNEKIKNLKK